MGVLVAVGFGVAGPWRVRWVGAVVDWVGCSGRQVGVFVGLGVEVVMVKVSATFASTVASIAVSASRVLRILASTVAGTSGVGGDAVCVSAGDGSSLVQATAARPKITKAIRMAVLIFFPQCCETFNRPYRRAQQPPALTQANSPAGGTAKTPSFPVRIQSLPFGLWRRIRTRGWPAESQRLRAMPKPWVLACVAEIPEVVANSIVVQIQVPVLVDTRVAR